MKVGGRKMLTQPKTKMEAAAAEADAADSSQISEAFAFSHRWLPYRNGW